MIMGYSSQWIQRHRTVFVAVGTESRLDGVGLKTFSSRCDKGPERL